MSIERLLAELWDVYADDVVLSLWSVEGWPNAAA